MRPLFDRLVEEAKKLGDDVRVEPKKHYIAFRRLYNFAIVYVYTDKLEVGLHLERPELDPRILNAEWGFSRILHRVILKDEKDIDSKFLSWLKASYDAS